MLASKLLQILPGFRDKRVAVFGDIILDNYVFGITNRVSREAPVLILLKNDEQFNLGGAGNTIRNLHELGARVEPVSIVGKDDSGKRVKKLLANMNVETRYVFQSPKRGTPLKTRILAGDAHTRKQQILRIDTIPEQTLSASDTDLLLSAIKNEAAGGLDALIISDYGCGVVNDRVIGEMNALAQSKKVVITVDSRFNAFAFEHVHALTPNESEFRWAANLPVPPDTQAILRLGKDKLKELDLEALLLTRGSEGLILFEKDGEPLELPVYGSRSIIDVTGAGDTVISVFTLAISSGLLYREAALLANIAGSVAVMKANAAAVSVTELERKIVNPYFKTYCDAHFR